MFWRGSVMAKQKICSVCQKEIAPNAKVCLNCGTKVKTPIYTKWWVWVIVVVLAIGGASQIGGGDTGRKADQNQSVQTDSNAPAAAQASKTEEPKKSEPSVPSEYKSALNKAKVYSKTMHMSKQGIYDQLTSEYGEKFSPEAAKYAIENIDADWKANALKKAEDYQSMNMSPAAIHDQLTSDYGEKFTKEEADYAIANLK